MQPAAPGTSGFVLVKVDSRTGLTVFRRSLPRGEPGDTGTSMLLVGSDLYVGGRASGDRFDTTPDALQRASRGGADGFLLRLSAATGQLEYATLHGGSGDDGVASLATDGSGGVFTSS